ncbi:hypothetical protein BSNT_09677 [Bacillus subtilis subsp. natto BEST195]|nr:hypothetical protein BSNT_09677 [Bacillus subtilis subsp. natto BEST195]
MSMPKESLVLNDQALLNVYHSRFDPLSKTIR